MIPPGFKMTELGPLPEDWEVVRFDKAVKTRGIKVGKVKQSEYKSKGKYPIIDQGQNLISGYWDNEEDVYKGELPVIIFGDHTRIFKFIDFPFVCGADGTKVLIPNSKYYDPQFLFYCFLTLKIPSRGYNRHFSLLKEKYIPLPPIPEQKAIARVLKTIQGAIEATERVMVAAKELKKSLMRHLFTYGPVPVSERDRVRLKQTEIGPIPEDWEVKTIGSLIEEGILYKIEDGNHGEKHPKDKDFVKEGIPFVTVNCLKNGKVIFDCAKFLEKTWLGKLKKGIARPKDVLISHKGSIGETAIVPNTYKEIILSPQITFYRVKNHNKLLYHFLFYVLSNETTLKRFFAIAKAQSTRAYISITKQKNIPIPLPPLSVQQKIAQILKAVDDKIEAEEKKKKALQALFKTMLHHLMTGRIRVKISEE